MRSGIAKVAFLIDKIASKAGGTENQLLTLIRGMDRSRVQPYLCVLRGSGFLSRECGEEAVYELDLAKLASLRAFSRISRFVRFLASEQIDVLESHFVDGNIVGCLAALRLPRLVLVSARRNQGHWRTPVYRMLFSILNRRVDLFLANCQATAEWACRSERIPQTKIRVIYNGVDLDRFAYDSQAVRREYRSIWRLSPGAPVIGIVAYLRPPKAIDVFLRAAAIVGRRLPDARFVVVGDGPLREEMIALAHRIDLDGKVFFLGSRDDVARLLAAFDVGVLSSSSESMPNSVLEYMAAGLPVVCTDVGGCREAVEHGVTGYVVAAGDPDGLAGSILRTLEDVQAREMGRKGRARVEALFAGDAMIRNHERLYVQLTKAGRHGLPESLDMVG